MISLKRIIEQQGSEGQYYDLGKDFANFRRTIDGADDQIKQRFEQAIGSKLNGKRISARASRGYKQYVKQYEFDVTKVTLDDYYDNYVVVAHDNTTPKPKEYFLKTGYKIVILGPASGQPATGEKEVEKPQGQQPSNQPTAEPSQPQQANPDAAQSQPMKPAQQQVKEAGAGTGHYDAYSIDAISDDIKSWLPSILLKPETAMRDFIKGLGWMKELDNGQSVALFDLKLAVNAMKVKLSEQLIQSLLEKINRHGTIDTKFELVKFEPNEKKDEFLVRIKKTMTDTTAGK